MSDAETSPQQRYWARMTAEERSAEVKRRMGTRKKRRRARTKKVPCTICGRRFTAKSMARHKRVAHTQKRGGRRGRVIEHQEPQQPRPHPGTVEPVSYLVGRIEALIIHFAASQGLPRTALTEGVADALHASVGGSLLGPAHQVSEVRRAAALAG